MCAGLIVLLAAPAELLGQATSAGTRIANSAQVGFLASDGHTYSVASNTEVVEVGQVGGVDIDPPRVWSSDPGATARASHALTNLGNGSDSFTVTGRSKAGWVVRFYLDANSNGALEPGDTLITAPITLPPGGRAMLLLDIDIPPVVSLRGTTDSITVLATSTFDSSVTDMVIDELQIRDAGIVVTLTNAADRTSAAAGEIVTYTVTYSVAGPGSATEFQLVDPIPVGATYVAGTLRLNGAVLTDRAGDDAGTFDAVGKRVVVVLPTIAGGDSGSITLQVRVDR